jgi:uncharacterized protein (TIGR03435 family)
VPASRCFASIAAAIISILFLSPSRAQQPSFEVASIKPSLIGKTRAVIDHGPDTVTMTNVSLIDLLEWAYDVKYFQISEGKTDVGRFDIRAKAPNPASQSDLRRMLQNLLAARYHLAVHREMRPIPVYELTVAKGGPKLPAPNPPSENPHRRVESLPRVENGNFMFADTTMPEFAAKLSMLRGIDRPILDKTGISGAFDIILESAASMIREGDETSLFSLIQGQLGLKFIPTKSRIEMLVVDSVVKPTEN